MNKFVKMSRKIFAIINKSLPENESLKKDHNSAAVKEPMAAVDIPPMYKKVGKTWCNIDTEIKLHKKYNNSEADIPRLYKKMR